MQSCNQSPPAFWSAVKCPERLHFPRQCGFQFSIMRMLEITTETSNHLIMLVETATWKRSRKVNLTVTQRRRNQICLQWLEWVTNFLFIFFCYAGNQSKKLFNSIIPESLQLLIYWPKGLKSLGTRLAECKMNQTMSLPRHWPRDALPLAESKELAVDIVGYVLLSFLLLVSCLRQWAWLLLSTDPIAVKKRPCHDTWYKKVKKNFKKRYWISFWTYS